MNDVLWDIRNDPSTRGITMAIFAFMYSIIILFGLVGNICVILAIGRNKSLQTVPNMFILSLSCSDVVVCCTSATITPITAFKKEWIFGSFLCSTAPFIAGVSLCFSTFTLTAISIDRFILIRFPMKKPFTHTQALFVIFFICTLAASLISPTILVMTLREIHPYCGMYCFENWGDWSNVRRAYGTIVLIMQFIIPFSIIIICYAAISVRLGQSLLLKGKKQEFDWQFKLTDQQKLAMKRRQRTNRMFIAMVVAFSASWIWSVLFNVLRDYDMLPNFFRSQEYIFGILTHCIAMTSTVWNPLLYAMLNLQLRAAFIQLVPKCLKPLLCCEFAQVENSDELRRRTKATTNAVPNGLTRDSYPNERNGCLHSQLPLLPNEMSMYENADTLQEETNNSKYGALDLSSSPTRPLAENGCPIGHASPFSPINNNEKLSDNWCETNEDRLPFNLLSNIPSKKKLHKTTSSTVTRHSSQNSHHPREYHNGHFYQNPYCDKRRPSYATFHNYHPVANQRQDQPQPIAQVTQQSSAARRVSGERRSSSHEIRPAAYLLAANNVVKPTRKCRFGFGLTAKHMISERQRFSSVCYTKNDTEKITARLARMHEKVYQRASSPTPQHRTNEFRNMSPDDYQDDKIRLLK